MTRRPLGRTRAVAGLLRAAALLPFWATRKPKSSGARKIQRSFYRTVLEGFGLSMEVRGTPSAAGGTLFVANHISWADIVLVGATIDALFVAKADVAHWPLVGRGARRIGTLFVERERRHGVSAQADAIRERLSAGDSVILFPEGTTADGVTILPFRTSLFAAADAARRIQPVAIAYVSPEGESLSPERLAEIAWTGNEALLPNAKALASAKTCGVLSFLELIDPWAFADRKALANEVRDSIVRAHAAASAGLAGQ